jgi:hypothetical protein
MHLRRLNRRDFATFALIVLGAVVVVAIPLFWVFSTESVQGGCPPGERFGSPGAPSYCVPANFYPTVTPDLTPHINTYGR